MYNGGSMKGVAAEIRQNVKFSPEIPVRPTARHLVLFSFPYVTIQLATSAFLFLVNISVNVSYVKSVCSREELKIKVKSTEYKRKNLL